MTSQIQGKILEKGKRYSFSEKLPSNLKSNVFRANFLAIINVPNCDYLLVKGYEDKIRAFDKNNTYIPLSWITKVESLEDIIKEQTILPSEMVLEIESFWL
jgi:hypothetical protein